MLQTVEVTIDEKGRVKTLEPIKLPKRSRGLLTILNDEDDDENVNLAALSEAVLARDWLRPEEDEAWAHLGELPSL
ncbi:MAG: hypothetical protein HOP19_05655 [Acidobacteria bacterium]|nr:hypothetical protein [Acidobacteriota bacterium]